MTTFTPDREEIAWAAGFFDGEGTTHFALSAESRSPRRRVGYPRLSVAQVGTETLQRFQHAVGDAGAIYGRSRSNVCAWQTGSAKQAYFVIGVLWHKLTPIKQAQAAKVFLRYREQLDTRPPRVKCQPGCECKRHQGVFCAPGCTCGRHKKNAGCLGQLLESSLFDDQDDDDDG